MTEHEELAALIDQIALAWEPNVCLLGNMTASQLARAATLLREPAPAPVPVAVAERPWERPGWCDAEGRCWWLCPDADMPNGTLPFWAFGHFEHKQPWLTHCLPHWAIPIPQPPAHGGEVEQ